MTTVEAINALTDERTSVFRTDPARAQRYADALDYWPGKFAEHAMIADLLAAEGHLDIIDSGGKGAFAPFLPDATITLVNPDVNGMDGCDLPFEDGRFDAGISTHTLEHVPISRRERFIEELVRVSRHDVYMIFPCGAENIEIDDAKTRFVGNTHYHDAQVRVTEMWLRDVFSRNGWRVEARGILNRAVHFMLAMLLPIDSDPKRAVCRWINERFDVTPALGDPYGMFIHVRKR